MPDNTHFPQTVWVQQTIRTKYHGATNYRGSRMSATSTSGLRVMLEHDAGLSISQNHCAALQKFCTKYAWGRQSFIAGSSGDGLVFTMIEKDCISEFDGMQQVITVE